MRTKIRFEDVPEALEGMQDQLSEILRRLESHRPNSAQASNKPRTIQEAARFTGKSVSTIYRLVSQKSIPFHKSGNKLYFFENELIEWIKGSQP